MKNKIDYKQLITGIKKSEENASELIEDANILLKIIGLQGHLHYFNWQ